VSTRVATAPAIRWYSDAPAAKEGETAEKKEEAPNAEAAKFKEDIEKKDKEIIELKVRLSILAMNLFPTRKLIHPNRTNTSALSPTSATSKNAPSAKQKPQKTLPSNASPATLSNPSTTSTAPWVLCRLKN
jgi:hypothetical protein